MVPDKSRKKKSINKLNNNKTRKKKKTSKKREDDVIVVSSFMLRFNITRDKSPDQDICYICGLEDHREHFCPFNYIYGPWDFIDYPAGKHRIITRTHRKFLRCFIRVTNLPPGFTIWDLEKLFNPYGPFLMCDVPRFANEICGCTSTMRMSFGVVVVKNRVDGERAINKLNGYEVGGRKLRIDWAYPSFCLTNE